MNAFYYGAIFVQDLRKKAARLVAAKCTLAARIDSFQENSVGASGKSELECGMCINTYTLHADLCQHSICSNTVGIAFHDESISIVLVYLPFGML